MAKALGVEPITAPPVMASDRVLSSREASEADLIYIRLHGRDDIRWMWYGEKIRGIWIPALSVDEIADADLAGKMVVAATCFGATSEFAPAFKAAGATYVSGFGSNYAAVTEHVIGADKLASGLAQGLGLGLSHAGAFRWARARLLPTAWRRADRDALAFTLI